MRQLLSVFVIWFATCLQSGFSAQPAECDGRQVNMRDYSVCIPETWHYSRDDRRDRLSTCSADVEHCTGNGGGFPLPGVVFVIIAPASQLPGNLKNPTDIVNRVQTERGEKAIEEIDLGVTKKCMLNRSLIMPTVWNEVYGLQVGSTLFRIWAQYQDKRDELKLYRGTIKKIVSSVSVRDGISK